MSNEVHEISLLEKKVNEVSAKYFQDSMSFLQERESSECTFTPHEYDDVLYLGQIFPFVNREQECINLVKCLGDMDLMRGDRFTDRGERNLIIPCCVGLPGIGKTRFARIAVTDLVGKATGLPSPTTTQMLEKSNEVAKTVWGNERRHDELLRELIRSSQQDGNIRMTLHYGGESEREKELEIIVAVLVQWMKSRKLLPRYEHLINDAIVEELTRKFNLLKRKCAFGETVKLILRQTSNTDPVLIINLDEAQSLSMGLKYALEILTKPLMTQTLVC